MAEEQDPQHPQDFFNVELRFLSEDVREAFKQTRDAFTEYMLGKARAVYLIYSLDDLLRCLIATGRYSKNEVKELEVDIHTAHMLCDTSGNSKNPEFVKLLHEDMKKISWLIASKDLFRKGATDKGKMEDRV